jgi:hypothetical protein
MDSPRRSEPFAATNFAIIPMNRLIIEVVYLLFAWRPKYGIDELALQFTGFSVALSPSSSRRFGEATRAGATPSNRNNGERA